MNASCTGLRKSGRRPAKTTQRALRRQPCPHMAPPFAGSARRPKVAPLSLGAAAGWRPPEHTQPKPPLGRQQGKTRNSFRYSPHTNRRSPYTDDRRNLVAPPLMRKTLQQAQKGAHWRRDAAGRVQPPGQHSPAAFPLNRAVVAHPCLQPRDRARSREHGDSRRSDRGYAGTGSHDRVGPALYRSECHNPSRPAIRATIFGATWTASRQSHLRAAALYVCVACHLDGTTGLPRPRDHQSSVMMMSMAPPVVNSTRRWGRRVGVVVGDGRTLLR